jgi:hypothetical protein
MAILGCSSGSYRTICFNDCVFTVIRSLKFFKSNDGQRLLIRAEFTQVSKGAV